MKFLLCLICLITVHKFKFEGHDYISFTKGHGVAVVHNPKCHCNLNEDY